MYVVFNETWECIFWVTEGQTWGCPVLNLGMLYHIRDYISLSFVWAQKWALAQLGPEV